MRRWRPKAAGTGCSIRYRAAGHPGPGPPGVPLPGGAVFLLSGVLTAEPALG